MTSTIPDSLAQDLRDHILATLEFPPAVRLHLETSEPPSPRIVILTGEPKTYSGMSGTARVPVEIQYISSLDRTEPDAHRIAAGKLDTLLRTLRTSLRHQNLASRVYLHDAFPSAPSSAIRAEDREQVTSFKADYVVTLISI